MILNMREQGFIFLLICFTGFCAGGLYDLLRVFRRGIKHWAVFIYFEDIIFWLLAAGVMLYLLMGINYADIRIYMTLGYIGGMLVYFNTLSPYVVECGVRLGALIFKPVILIIFLLKSRLKCGIILIRKTFKLPKEMFLWRLKKWLLKKKIKK